MNDQKTYEICNLKNLFGDKYKITNEGSAQIPEDKEWEWQIPCQSGGHDAHIYTHGYMGTPNTLGFSGSKRGSRILNKLLKIPGVHLHVEGDDEFLVTFPQSCFDQVAAIVNPRRKRRLSKRRKAVLVGQGKRHQFQGKRRSGANSEKKGAVPTDILEKCTGYKSK